jgi:hypothetical protein
MKKTLLLGAAIGLFSTVYTQYEYSSFTESGRGASTTFATDYHALGINPANLGWASQFDDKRFTLGFNEFSFSVHSQALTKQELRDEFKGLLKGESNNFTWAQKRQAASNFVDAGFAMNADYGTFGFSFQTEKFGGIAFRINDRFQWYSKLGAEASEILFTGYNASYFDSLVVVDPNTFDTTIIANSPNLDETTLNNVINGFTNNPRYISQIMDGSQLSGVWYREYNLSYGRKIFGKDSLIEVFGGGGIKYLQGLAMIHVSSNGGNYEAFSAITPFFNIDYGTAANTNPSTVSQTGLLPNAVGQGFGADIGLNVLLFNKLKIGASVTNIGSITWTGNVYSAKDTLLHDTDSEGLNSYNIAGQLSNLSGEDGLFQWQGEQERVVALPTMMRFGASYRFSDKLEVGADIIIPGNEVPGNLDRAIIGIGGDVSPVKWLRLSAGMVTGGNYDFQLPLGVMFRSPSGSWEGGIASRDAITFFTQNGPTLSTAFGFSRFRF